MKRLFRLLTAALLMFGFVGPFSTATTFAQTQAGVQAANPSVTGSIHDSSGAPVANATVKLTGATTLTATTDAQGAFSFTNVAPGIYSFEATKAGYTTASESSVTVLAGQTQSLAVVMNAISFSSLRTVASVRSVGRGTFNTTPASVNVVSSQTFELRGQQQVMHVLDAVPGVQMSIAGNGVNGASPGGISFANVRGARSYETATLIDGHPLFVGDYGDYVSNFLNSFMFKDVETVKGPGATVPQVNFALGGTVNFITKDPTFEPQTDVTFGVGSYGGTYENFGFSDTLGTDKKLGVVFDFAENNTGSPFNGQRVYFSNFPGFYFNNNGQMSSVYSQGSAPTQVGNTNSKTSPGTAVVACCLPINGFLNTTSELAKLRYNFSSSTGIMVSYLGGQARADQFANNADVQDYVFQPLAAGAGTPAYTGSLKPGTVIPVVYAYPSQFDYETNNEPILQTELHTTLGKDTVIGRYYHAGIVRLQYQGTNDPTQPEYATYNIYGNQNTQAKYGQYGADYTGAGVQIANYEYYRATEQDKIDGYSLEYQHPMGDDLLTLSADTSRGQSASYSYSGASKPGAAAPPASVSIPAGSSQTFTTYMLREMHRFNPKLQATLSLYGNLYKTVSNNKSQSGANACLADGTNCQFETENTSHFDERFALAWRPTPDWAIRASAGSSIVPPYLGLLTAQTTGLPYATTSNTSYVKLNSFKNPNLLPETAFGYDLGFDRRLGNQMYVSFDGYLTNMFNGYFQQLVPTGATCATAGYCTGPQAGNASIPVYASYNANLSNARFEGLELELKRVPVTGLGFDAAASVQRGYAYNLPACFYSNVFKKNSNQLDCTQFTTNLNVVAGQNFTGGGNFMPVYDANGTKVTASTGVSAQNQSIPYFTGNLSVNYTFANGAYAEVGETFLGKNNSYNEPAFGIGYASIRYPLNKQLALQVSGDNIFNAYTGLYPLAGAGVPINLANGGTAATNANVLGPATYQLTLFFHAKGNP